MKKKSLNSKPFARLLERKRMVTKKRGGGFEEGGIEAFYALFFMVWLVISFSYHAEKL